MKGDALFVYKFIIFLNEINKLEDFLILTLIVPMIPSICRKLLRIYLKNQVKKASFPTVENRRWHLPSWGLDELILHYSEIYKTNRDNIKMLNYWEKYDAENAECNQAIKRSKRENRKPKLK